MIAWVSEEAMTTSVSAREMADRLQRGDMRALARAVSMVEDGADGMHELLVACQKNTGHSLRIGVTGAPGAGKSTLVDQMVRWLRQQGKTVAVVAVDPSSLFTGGALLGDRIRMQEVAEDAGVFVRSMASRGARGGVASAVAGVCDVMAASGRDAIVIETVGVGQDEVEVTRLTDVTVLVLVPGMGDDVQSLKAGVMEAADVFAVNKSDREGAERVVAEIIALQGLSDGGQGWVPPVVRTIATTGEGVPELMEVVTQCGELKRARREIKDNKDWTRELRLDHLGVAVKSITSARGFYEMLGMTVTHEETVEHEQVRVAMLSMGESRLELLEPIVEDSVIGRFLAKRGEGLHHVAVKVANVDAAYARLKKNGVCLVSDEVRVGAGGHRYFFVHPTSTGGVLVEVVGEG